MVSRALSDQIYKGGSSVWFEPNRQSSEEAKFGSSAPVLWVRTVQKKTIKNEELMDYTCMCEQLASMLGSVL
jgi:hypothetical protein